MSTSASVLKEIPVRLIDRNPENPRILFRPGELQQLQESIRQHGIQVPVSVYKERSRFILIDGERRWRCAVKLNLDTVPALIQNKPKPLMNLLLMFNIHALREQWDLFTIAAKLPRVIGLLESESGSAPNDKQVAAHTGLPLAVIRRSKLLIELPDEYKDVILEELEKPKAQQRLTEDFFIEMERALKTVERAMPGIIGQKDDARHVLMEKYKAGTISNIVQFRQMAKIGRAERVGADPKAAKRALARLFVTNAYGIEAAYQDSVSGMYTERELNTRLQSLIERLRDLHVEAIDRRLAARLRELLRVLQRLLRGSR